MGISVNVLTFKKEEIEKLINEYPKINSRDLRKAFETCGKFLGEYYVILDNQYADAENPYSQLSCWIDELFVKSKGKKLKDEEEFEYEDFEISRKLFDLYLSSEDYDTVPSWMDRFEYIEYNDIYEDEEDKNG